MEIRNFNPNNYEYSRNLQHIPQPPSSLFICGDLPKTRIKSVAIVGARKPTAYGHEVAANLAVELARHGVVIISGLAYGIDKIAHQATLDAGGTTIAVLAGGLDNIYPTPNRSLAKKIVASGGALLSEYPAGMSAMPHQFLERNRLVSGLADAVVVVEAAARSGTLSTANHALDQGKEVFAVPGNITSPLSEGCNQLIKNGATPLLSAQDVLEFLFPEGVKTQQISLLQGENDAENAILALLAQGFRDSAEILSKSGLTPIEFNQALTMLELRGAIKSIGNNQFSL